MMMVTDTMRMALVTTHIPLQEVAATITRDRLCAIPDTLIQSLKIDFGINRPVIAVPGLNPHATHPCSTLSFT